MGVAMKNASVVKKNLKKISSEKLRRTCGRLADKSHEILMKTNSANLQSSLLKRERISAQMTELCRLEVA